MASSGSLEAITTSEPGRHCCRRTSAQICHINASTLRKCSTTMERGCSSMHCSAVELHVKRMTARRLQANIDSGPACLLMPLGLLRATPAVCCLGHIWWVQGRHWRSSGLDRRCLCGATGHRQGGPHSAIRNRAPASRHWPDAQCILCTYGSQCHWQNLQVLGTVCLSQNLSDH